MKNEFLELLETIQQKENWVNDRHEKRGICSDIFGTSGLRALSRN